MGFFSFFKDFFSVKSSLEEANFKNYIRYTIFLGLVFIFFFGLSIAYTLREAQTYQLIDFKNRDLLFTMKWLQDRSLKAKIFERIDVNVAKYNIISHNPAAGEEVKEGRTVSLVVSVGDQFVKMPNLISKDFSSSRNKIYSMFAGYKTVPNVVKVSRYSTLDEGLVVEQFPKENENLTSDQEVILVVSRGKVEKAIAVENYQYKNFRTVESELINKGVKVKGNYLVTKSKNRSGQIVSQSVHEGDSLLPGQEIVFEVSYYSGSDNAPSSREVLRFYQLQVPFVASDFNENELNLGLTELSNKNSGLGEDKKPQKESVKVADTVENVEKKVPLRYVRLVVKDAIGRHIAFDENVQSGDKIDFPYKTIGKGTLEVYLDKELYESIDF